MKRDPDVIIEPWQEALPRAHRILGAAQRMSERRYSNAGEIEIHTEGYAEPGYKNPESGIVATGNWNPDKWPKDPKAKPEKNDSLACRVSEAFAKLGIEMEWSDEWTVCYRCDKLVRSQGNSYGWRPAHVFFNGEILCHECLKEQTKEYLESLEGDDGKCVQVESIDPKQHGYRRLGEAYQNGLHEHMTDDPKKIGEAMRKAGITRYLFKQDLQSQFYIEFSVWIHKSQIALASKVSSEELTA